MKTIEAVYERGVLRPLAPLALPEGTRVSVSFTERNGELEGAAGVAEAAEPRGTPVNGGGAERQKAIAEFLAEIAALPTEGKGDPFSGEDHDKVLYGWDRSSPT